MEEIEIMSLIPKLYFLKGKKSRYEVLKEIGLDIGGTQYKKFKEFIVLGFIEEIGNGKDGNIKNPPIYTVAGKCKERMWKFVQNTPMGECFIRMVKDNKIII